MLKRISLALVLIMTASAALYAEEPPLSPQSKSCMGCHSGLTPGIVSDWKTSRHAVTTPSDAWSKPAIERRISALDETRKDTVVGCFECHGLRTDEHTDSFDHYGFKIYVVVSPEDCALCHPAEVEEYSGSKKAHAIGNLKSNPVYHTLVNTIISHKEVEGPDVTASEPSDYTRQETCFACHGTTVKSEGLKTIKTKLGAIKVPDLKNWPNHGAGRINPDGSMGSCTPCHARHAFSIEMARKPHTCAQCHLEPDVPAWNVYDESKHGNIYMSSHSGWDFNAVPWKLGEDFKAPTCAACHVSLITSPKGNVMAERSHDFSSRLWVRLFGLIYTHPQPKSGDTSVIRNDDGLPLPTTFTGIPASKFLIDETEQLKRRDAMKAVCRGCHNTDYINAHFLKLENTLKETDAMTLSATKLLLEAWKTGLADNKNPFDEAIEQKWIKQWLFYGNSTRYASAMTGAPDYTAFKYGWWGLTTNLEEMRKEIEKARKKRDEEDD